jgi:1-acyl-sn-glycerol-3-phosphate acyltransferase
MAKHFSVAAVLARNLIFYGGLTVWTLLSFPIFYSIFLYRVHIRHRYRRRVIRELMHLYGGVCCKIFAILANFETLNKNSELPDACIITPNHQSFLDPYCIGLFPIKNHVFVVRKWPFRIPLYGAIMREAGYLNSEETDAEGFFEKAGALLREGAALVVYPEGTRSATGKIGRFRSGAFRLAVENNVPIIPMCIDGTGKVFPKGKAFGRQGLVRVSLLKRVKPEDFLNFGDVAHIRMKRHVKAVMEDALRASF